MKKRNTKRKQTKWMKHVISYKKSHPNKTFGQCMKLARPSYKPIKK